MAIQPTSPTPSHPHAGGGWDLPFMVDAQARARNCDWPVRSFIPSGETMAVDPRPAPGAGRVASSQVFPPRDDTE
jgi:hypothetical protein